MLKLLKAKNTKARKVVKNESVPAGTKNEDNVDILKMVREINLDNLGISNKAEVSNGHEDVGKKIKTDQKHWKKRKRVGSEKTNVSVSKQRRLSAQGAYKVSISRNASKGSLSQEEGSSESDEELRTVSEGKMSLQENMVEPAESDLLVTCLQNNSNSLSKRKSKISDKDRTNEANKVGGLDDYDVKVILFAS